MSGRCELCGALLNEDTMISHGEFFVCEECDAKTGDDDGDLADIGEPTAPHAVFVVPARVKFKTRR